MKDKLMKLLGRENINNIKISKAFKKNPPKWRKMWNKLVFYRIYNKFEQPIVINKENYLTDGYTTYLLALKFGMKYVKVKRV